jgi:tetratricopeptide (TPR) repeat protein
MATSSTATRRSLAAARDAYRRAIELDPAADKPRVQLMLTSASLGQPEEAIAEYEAERDEHPHDPRPWRLLATAFNVAHRYVDAEVAARAGIDVAPDDGRLTNLLGEALAGQGRVDEALDAWRRGYALDPESLEGRYGSAFLLEKTGLLREAADEWRFILAWSERRGNSLDAEWPRRELVRLAGG